jgi:hypothetical protein
METKKLVSTKHQETGLEVGFVSGCHSVLLQNKGER